MTGGGPPDPNDPFGQTRPQHPQSGGDQPGQVPPGQNPPPQVPPQQNPPTRSFDPIEGEQYPYSVPIPASDDYYGSQSAHGQDQTYGYGTAYSQQQPGPVGGDPAGPPPRRRTGRWIAIALAIVVALVVIVGAVVYATKGSDDSSSAGASTTATSMAPTSNEASTSTSAPSSSNPNGPEVTYEVTGGPLVVTYFGNGSLRTVATPPSPWTMTVTLRNGFASVTAISKGSPVTCTIKRGDTVITTQTSAAVAFCTATGVGN